VLNGLFNRTIVYCSTTPTGTATIDVFDLSTLKKNTTSSALNITGSGVFNVGQVAACGVQTAVRYTANFVDQNGANLTQYYVSFDTIKVYPQTSSINTIIPANKTLTRKIYVYTTCGGYVLVDSTQVGPFANDFNAGTISVNVPQPNSFTISGSVNTCSNTPVTNGYATIMLEGKTYTSIINNGSFSVQITRCNTSAAIAIINVLDNANNQQNATPITFSVSNTNVNIGTVQACGVSLNEFLNYTVGTNAYNTKDSLIAYYAAATPNTTAGTNLAGMAFNPFGNFNAKFNGNTLGTFNLTLTHSDATMTQYSSTQGTTVTITEYGAVGQYIAGTFSGNVTTSITSPLTAIAGSFRIKRTQ
jgi:hypothetical protein